MRLGRLNQIQFLRFLAFFLLFEYHASAWIPNYSNNNVTVLFALVFFILLSGFMSSYSLYYKDIEPTVHNILRYFRKKLIRFYPLYLITNLITVIYTIPFGSVAYHNFKDVFTKGFEFVATIFMFQTWIFRPFIFNAASWYIASIIWLSLLNIPFSSFSKKIIAQDKAMIKFVGIAIISIIYTVLAAIVAMAVFHLSETDGITAHPLIIGGIYVTGMALGNIAILIKERNPELENKTTLFTWIEILLFVLSYIIVSYNGEGNAIVYILPILLDCAILIIFTLGYGKLSKLFSRKTFVMLGNITFEAYLIHQVIIFLFANINGWGAETRLGNLYALSFCLVTSLVIAMFLYNTKQKYPHIPTTNIANEIVPIHSEKNRNKDKAM